MDLSAINKVGRPEEFLPLKKLSELEMKKEYTVTGMRTSQTKWGTRITVDLDGEFTCFLPSRFVQAFEEQQALFQQMTVAAGEKKLRMIYYGSKYNHLEFKEATE